MPRSIVGTRIREHRRRAGITQTDLAKHIGISPSYLNLIEGNKRRITEPLLQKVAAALDLGAEDLDGAAEHRLIEDLTEIAYLPPLAPLEIEIDQAGDLIGRFPGWSRAIAALARAEDDANKAARAMADRISHDPFLGESVHRLLSRVSAIRSTAEILGAFDDIDAADQQRFFNILAEESRGLSDVGEALASYFDRRELVDTQLTPQDEVEAFFDARRNHFPEIEGLPAAELEPAIARLLAEHPELETEAARARAAKALRLYAADAAAMPLDSFSDVAAQEGYDVELLAEVFSTGIAQVCRRLTSLPSAPERPRFGYVRANAAGTITAYLGLPGLNLPRYAASCPLWVLYRAQQRPEQMLHQHAMFPNGERFVFAARARNTGPTGFDQPRHYVTDMLVLAADRAGATVYAPDPAKPGEAVGPACRICPRKGCAHRVEDPFGDPVAG
ncbi:MAG: short-chain fatty acyl-CoA regulator family protein [Pseudomonadota bacterium]